MTIDNAPLGDDTAKARSDTVLATLIALAAVFFFLFAQFVFGFVGLIIFGIMNGSAGGEADIMKSLENPAFIALPTIWSVLVSNLFVFGMLWLYLRRGDRLEKMGWYRWSAHGRVKTAIAAIVCISAALTFNHVYTEYLFPDLEMQALMKEMIASIPKTIGNQILLFVTIAVVAPIIEEVIFRGMLQNNLQGWLPSWVAIFLSAFIFAVIHMQPEAIGALMALGAAFGVIYHYTKSLRLTILLHVVTLALTPSPT